MVAGLSISLLSKAGGEPSVLDAQDSGLAKHRGSPPPASNCRVAGALDFVPPWRDPEKRALCPTVRYWVTPNRTGRKFSHFVLEFCMGVRYACAGWRVRSSRMDEIANRAGFDGETEAISADGEA